MRWANPGKLERNTCAIELPTLITGDGMLDRQICTPSGHIQFLCIVGARGKSEGIPSCMLRTVTIERSLLINSGQRRHQALRLKELWSLYLEFIRGSPASLY